MSDSTVTKKDRYRFVVLAMNTLVYMVLMAILVSFSISSPFLKEEFGLNDVTLNYGYMAYSVGIVFSMWWGGRFFDRYGMRRTMIAASLFFLIPQFLIPSIGSWSAIVVLRFLQGNVIAVFPGLVAINGLWFTERERGLASGIFMGGLALGTATGNYLCSLLLPLLGWRDTFIALGIISLALIIAWFVIVAKRTGIGHSRSEGMDGKDKREIYRDPVTWLLALIMLGNCWQIYAIYGITQGMLFGYGYDLETVGLLCLALGLTGALSTPLGGFVSDILGKRSGTTRGRILSMLMGFVMAFFGTLLVPFLAQEGYAMALIAMVLAGFGVPWTNGPYWALPTELFPEGLAGEGAGFSGFLGNTADIFAPVIAVFLGANYGWVSSMSFLAIGPLISAVACIILLRMLMD
jgi:MFS family permease